MTTGTHDTLVYTGITNVNEGSDSTLKGLVPNIFVGVHRNRWCMSNKTTRSSDSKRELQIKTRIPTLQDQVGILSIYCFQVP
jgi:hypothetical protein